MIGRRLVGAGHEASVAVWPAVWVSEMAPLDRDLDSKSLGPSDSQPSTTPGEPDDIASALAERFGARVRLFAARRLRDRTLAEDVAQEALKRTLVALRAGSVENEAALPAFLFQTARHVCMQTMRSVGRQDRAYTRFSAGEEPRTREEEDPLSFLISAQQRETVREALGRLGRSDREVLLLTFGDDLDTEEIARRLRLTPVAVRVRRHRALAKLGRIVGVTKPEQREP